MNALSTDNATTLKALLALLAVLAMVAFGAGNALAQETVTVSM